jgi:hypothetical protein
MQILNQIEEIFEAKRRREKLRVNYKSIQEFNLEALKEFK